MVKKTNKYAGMHDMFVQKEIEEKTAIFESARSRLEQEIAELERESVKYDSGLSNVETRNEIRYLNDEIRHLEQKYYEDILKLKALEK